MVATPSATDPTDWVRPLHERQIAALGRLADVGLGMAVAFEEQVKAAAALDAAAAAQWAMAYGRAARAVRLSFLLQTQVIKTLKDHERHAGHMAASDRREARSAAVTRVKAIVGRIAERQLDDEDELERVCGETTDRLDRDDIYGDVLDRPVSELVAMICRDLGLDPDWPRLAEEAWAQAEMAGGDLGWPLAMGRRPESIKPGGRHQEMDEPEVLVTIVPPS